MRKADLPLEPIKSAKEGNKKSAIAIGAKRKKKLRTPASN